jgi:hypothetical protein
MNEIESAPSKLLMPGGAEIWRVPATPDPVDKAGDAETKGSADSSQSGDPEDGDEPDASGGEGKSDEFALKKARPRQTPREAIIGASMELATTSAQRRALKDKRRQWVAVIQVPTAAWVKQVESYVLSTFIHRVKTYARTGSNKTRDLATVGNDEVSKDLAEGRRAIGIAATVSMLPAALVSAADFVIKLPSPNGDLVRRALKRCASGRVPATIDDKICAGLDFDDLAVAMRAGSTAREVVERLRAASNSRVGAGEARLPDLETAVEFGAAREWGLSLARDIVDYRAGAITWQEVDRGVVVHSPPGFGKSMFARILARQCGLPLVSSSVAELFATSPGHLDGVIKAQRAMFAKAATLAPCILFIDEIDAVPNRDNLKSHNADWWLPVVNDFLMQLDSAVAGQRDGIVVVGATNRMHAIDPAIMRPGRLEKAIEIKRPTLAGVVNVLRFHLAGDLTAEDLTSVGQMLGGSTPAQIMYCVRSARRIARRAGRILALDDFRQAILPQEDIAPDRLFRIAVHEAGHAVLALVLNSLSVRDIGLLPQESDSYARTRFSVQEDDLPTRQAMDDYVTVVLAGRAAERVLAGSMSAGAGGSHDSDLGIATSLVAAMHASYGLDDSLVCFGTRQDAVALIAIDGALKARVERHLQELQRRADELVERHREVVLEVARRLSSDRYVSGDVLTRIFEASRASHVGEDGAS